jgi:hypothetical protein
MSKLVRLQKGGFLGLRSPVHLVYIRVCVGKRFTFHLLPLLTFQSGWVTMYNLATCYLLTGLLVTIIQGITHRLSERMFMFPPLAMGQGAFNASTCSSDEGGEEDI